MEDSRSRYETYTADEEEPKCNRCDYLGGGFECEKLCGPEHGWWGYRRTEVKEKFI